MYNNKKHLLNISQITKSQVLRYIERACQIKNKDAPLSFPDKTLLTMFYEPSTRTSGSFQAAAIKLNCKVISMTDKYSSSQKGETLEDTIKTINYYADAIVLRHPENGSARRAAEVSKVPIINAGDGNGEHPTQALIDIMTMYTELKNRNIDLLQEARSPICITFVGDLKNSRTIHSLIGILTLFPNLQFIYIAPPSLEMPAEITAYLDTCQHIRQAPSGITLQEAIPITDVLYITRIQKERFSTEREYYSIALSHHYKNYCITTETLMHAKQTAIIMHPLPRTIEIHPDVDNDPRAMYMTQVENGVYMRMAILEDIFSTS